MEELRELIEWWETILDYEWGRQSISAIRRIERTIYFLKDLLKVRGG